MKSTHTQSRTIATKGLTALFATLMLGSTLSLVGLMGGCRGDRTDKPPRQFFPDMDYQPKLKPQSESEFFVDGRSNRTLVQGTVPFGTSTHDTTKITDKSWSTKIISDRAAMLKDDESYYFGLVAGTQSSETPQYLDQMPVKMNKALIERGQGRYNIFCSMCHGYDGSGGNSGTVGRLWSMAPANLVSDPRFQDKAQDSGKDGYLFTVIRDGLHTPDGKIRMPSYKHAVDEYDAWAIIAYMRVLQKAQAANPEAFDPASRDQTNQAQAQDTNIPSTTTGGE